MLCVHAGEFWNGTRIAQGQLWSRCLQKGLCQWMSADGGQSHHPISLHVSTLYLSSIQRSARRVHKHLWTDFYSVCSISRHGSSRLSKAVYASSRPQRRAPKAYSGYWLTMRWIGLDRMTCTWSAPERVPKVGGEVNFCRIYLFGPIRKYFGWSSCIFSFALDSRQPSNRYYLRLLPREVRS